MRGFNSDLIGVFHSWAVHLRKNRAVKSPKNYRSPADEQRNYQAARPHFVEAATLYSQGELSQAETALERHLRMAPQSWPGLCLKALLAEQTHRYALAETIVLALLQAKPDYAAGHCQLGRLCVVTGRLDPAVGHFQKALALDPTLRSASYSLGTLYQTLGRYSDAMDIYQAILRVDPGSAETYFHLGQLQRQQSDLTGAVAAYRQVLSLDPTHGQAASNLLFCQHYLSEVDAHQRLVAARTLGPLFAQKNTAQVPPPARDRTRPDPDRVLRIGVVSADLRRHPVAFLLEPVLQHLQHHPWQWFAFSNTAQQDALTARLRPHFAVWHTVDTWSDTAVLKCISDAQIDILIDLSGHTAGHRLAVFAARAAPVQLSWLGYFASTGVAHMDHLLVGPQCVPDSETGFYTEQIVRLPVSRWCWAAPSDAPAVGPLPVLAGRPFTFGCFQELAKINDGVLRAWLQILVATPNARLRIQSVRLGYTAVAAQFSQKLLDMGFKPSQFQLLGPTDHAAYLRAYAEVDMVLDTFPYPGGMTTLEALWMGVPSLTLAMPGILGRQGASLLTAVGLSQWVCQSVDAYTERAIALAAPAAGPRAQLSELRAGLRRQLQASALLNAEQFTADLYATLRDVWRQYSDRTCQPPEAAVR